MTLTSNHKLRVGCVMMIESTGLIYVVVDVDETPSAKKIYTAYILDVLDGSVNTSAPFRKWNDICEDDIMLAPAP